MFRLHGRSNWFINRSTGEAIEIAANNPGELGVIFNLLWHGLDPWIPGIIAPATAKDNYAVAPPFNTAYDYLAEGLKHAKVVVVVGQRLRDDTLRELFFWTARTNADLKYVIVGRDRDPSPYFTDCLPAERVTYLSGGFPERRRDVVAHCGGLLGLDRT